MRRTLAAMVLLVLVTKSAGAGVTGVAAIGMTVGDLDRSVTFYTKVLGFERDGGMIEAKGEPYETLYGVFPVRFRRARLRLGDERVELTEWVTPEGRPAPEGSRSNDRWFQHLAIVVRDMDAAYERLAKARVRHVSPEPQRLPDWNPNAGGIRAFYFRDPDGHPLELIWFPPGKGDPRWQARTHRLFLGIDHTAIAVADTDTSIAFYRDRLGLRVAGGSDNYGIEQARLNAVRGAHLRITGLRGARGPGVELLEYVAPRTGRPAPDDVRPNDLVFWQTRFVADDPAALDRFGGPVVLPSPALGFERAVELTDPDGHHLEVVAP